MSISGQNLSIIIVTLKSDNVIDNCIKSINKNIPIIVVENSSNVDFKNYLEKKYKNVNCVLSENNIGMGAGNNIGIKLAKTDYVLIVNPDTTFESNTLDELYSASEKIDDFTILSPICSDKNFPNYDILNKKKDIKENEFFFKVNYVDGFAMILNKQKFPNNDYFDENFFMYLENNDLCRRVINNNGSIYIASKSKINHLGAQTVNSKYSKEIELSRNWHWVWSKYYYNKKNFGLLKAIQTCGFTFFSSLIKFLFFLFMRKNFKTKIYFNRVSGIYNAFIGKTSWYRPNLKD